MSNAIRHAETKYEKVQIKAVFVLGLKKGKEKYSQMNISLWGKLNKGSKANTQMVDLIKRSHPT